MVHGGVEDTAVAVALEGGLYATEFAVPSGVGSSALGIEIPCETSFSIEVGGGIGLGYRTEGDAHEQRLVGAFELQVIDGCGTVGTFALHGRLLIETRLLVEAHHKVAVLLVSPTVTDAVTHVGIRVNLLQTSPNEIVVNAVLEIDIEMVMRALGIGEAIEGCALGGRNFGVDAALGHHETVVARSHFFLLVAESGGEPLTGELQVFDGRHDGDVAQIGATGAAEVCLCEAYNLRATLMVAGTPVPTRFNLRRACVDHSEGYVGAYEHMAVVARADAGIDV